MTASKIEWTDRSDWNPIRGCTRVSPGCGGPGPHGGCYAEAMAARFSDPGQWGHGFAERVNGRGRWTGKVELQLDRLTLPLRWRKPAPGRNKVFATSTSDPFHGNLRDDEIDLIFATMALAKDWIFQVLTKRSDRMRAYCSNLTGDDARWFTALQHVRTDQGSFALADAHDKLHKDGLLHNVWLGVSVEDQRNAEERIPDLLRTPAATRWISAEPMLGALNLRCLETSNDFRGYAVDALSGAALSYSDADGTTPFYTPKLDWVVAGLESGPDARDNDGLANMRSLLAQCQAAGTPFFGKQGFKKQPLPDDLMVRQFPAGVLA